MNAFQQKYIDLARGIIPPVDEWEMRNFHIAFALHKNRLVAQGTNRKATHPMNLRNRKKNGCGIDYSETKLTCAEWICLNRVKRKTNIPFNKIKLLSIRIDRNNQIRIARPCESCSSLLSFLNVSDVIFTNDLGEFEEYY